jgi:hypothetical protein
MLKKYFTRKEAVKRDGVDGVEFQWS